MIEPNGSPVIEPNDDLDAENVETLNRTLAALASRVHSSAENVDALKQTLTALASKMRSAADRLEAGCDTLGDDLPLGCFMALTTLAALETWARQLRKMGLPKDPAFVKLFRKIAGVE